MKKFSRLVAAVVALVFVASALSFAAGEEEILSIQFYLDRHFKEYEAAVQGEDQMRTPGQTTALGDIEKALETADDYVDLDVALTILDTYSETQADSPYKEALAPVYRLFTERLNVAIVRGRKELEAKREDLLGTLQTIGFGRTRAPFEFLRGMFSGDGEQALLVELADNRSGRRVAWLEEVIKHHGGRLIDHCPVKHDKDKYKTHNILLAGSGECLGKLYSHYGGIIPAESFRVRIKLKSGGFLSKKKSDLIVEPPNEFDAVTSLSWIKGNVIEQGWDYIHQNYREELEKHAKTKEMDGKEYFVVKGAELEYEIFYPHSREIVVQKAEKSFGDLYYEMR